MARRNDHTREELRELALAAAEEIVQTQGVTALSTRKVAAGIGYSVGSLYTIFSNLDDLCWQLNMRTLAELLQLLQQQQMADPRACLHACALAYLQFAQRHPERWRLLFEHRSPEGKQMPEVLSAQIATLFSCVDVHLEQIFPACDEVELAIRTRTLWSGVHGMAHLRAGDKLFLDRSEDVSQMLTRLVDGLLDGWDREDSVHA